MPSAVTGNCATTEPEAFSTVRVVVSRLLMLTMKHDDAESNHTWGSPSTKSKGPFPLFPPPSPVGGMTMIGPVPGSSANDGIVLSSAISKNVSFFHFCNNFLCFDV